MRNKTIIGTLAAGAIIAIGCSSGGADTADTVGPGAQGAGAPANGSKRTIILEVAGAKKADITYGLGVDTSQDGGAKLPWKKTLTSSETLLIAQVSAQNAGGGEITCKITVDGKVVKTNKSTGEYSIVDCTASDI